MNTMKMTALSRRGLGVLLGTAVMLAAVPGMAQDKKKFALVQINQQALFFNQMNEGAQKAASTRGSTRCRRLVRNPSTEPTPTEGEVGGTSRDSIDDGVCLRQP